MTLQSGRPWFHSVQDFVAYGQCLEVVSRLQVQPGNRVAAEVAGQAFGGVGADAAALIDDFVDAGGRYAERYGQGMEDSLTWRGERLQILLLHTLAAFASRLAGLGCEATGIDRWLSPIRSTRKLYSTLRVGREALVGHWPMEPISVWLNRLRSLPPSVLGQMALSA